MHGGWVQTAASILIDKDNNWIPIQDNVSLVASPPSMRLELMNNYCVEIEVANIELRPIWQSWNVSRIATLK